jgi:hypothetical protein
VQKTSIGTLSARLQFICDAAHRIAKLRDRSIPIWNVDRRSHRLNERSQKIRFLKQQIRCINSSNIALRITRESVFLTKTEINKLVDGASPIRMRISQGLF